MCLARSEASMEVAILMDQWVDQALGSSTTTSPEVLDELGISTKGVEGRDGRGRAGGIPRMEGKGGVGVPKGREEIVGVTANFRKGVLGSRFNV